MGMTNSKYNHIVAELDKANDAHEGITGILNNFLNNNEEDHNQRGFLHIKMLVEAWGTYVGLIDILNENIGTHKSYVRRCLIYGGILESEAEIEAEFIEGMERAMCVIVKTEVSIDKALRIAARRNGKSLVSIVGGITYSPKPMVDITIQQKAGDTFYDYINGKYRD